MRRTVRYSVVVPVYNEEQVLPEFQRELAAVLRSLGESFEILYVDDGSGDRSLEILRSLAAEEPEVGGVRLSRNFGHQVALSAGLDLAEGEAVITLDADLQDPPALIPELIARWREGAQVVLARRRRRRGEGLLKRASSRLFYRLLRGLSGLPLPLDVGDFRLLDREVCLWLRALPERHRYLRGLIGWAGFRQAEVPFDRQPRRAGRSKYPPARMLRFALDGLTSFSIAPLRAASGLGALVTAGGLAYLLYVLHRRLIAGATVEGWSSIVSLLVIFNGVILMLLGVLGEYVGRIYEEVKGRPLYMVRERFGSRQDEGP
jgi:glycosyltransferase involved in cell wall biosynthesis